ncbi:conserved hypothetical protein [Chitinophaga jiangningensis]|uniref:Mucoidy inhibitor MuiA family protein n=1 Tax=Chitinophaga jiangningensis TaxID=1419482 RepID=A0A1M6VIF5_9BACT|nr:mucoidy inhibitor MuiA family protein [Chitinophaga jiangningensis]SHK81282.1 conserved hypothetical protein [Chitinophaga jiangningensis]
MNRVLFLAVLLAISLKNNAQAKKQTIPSTINKVTVFTQGAQVERSATVAVPQGTSQIVISELSPDLEEKSIQVNLPADFTLLSVTRQVNNLRLQAHLEETEALAAEQKKLEQQLAKEKNNETVYNEEKAMLGKNQVVTGDNGLKAADLKEALDLQRSRLSEVMAKLLEIKNNQVELTEQIEKINRQLGRFSAHNLPPTSDIILNVQTKNPASGKLTLTYMVKNAGWIPAYDIRVKDINNPINLVYKANVFQTCGEEWKNVKLALSSGSPEESNTKPTLSPWYLRNFRSVDDLNMALRSQVTVNGEVSGVVTDGTTSQPMPGVTVRVKGRTIGTTTDAQGRFKLQQPAGNNLLEFSYIGYERQELSPASAAFVYMIPITTSLNETVVVSNGITNELQGKVAGITSSSQRAIAKKVDPIK